MLEASRDPFRPKRMPLTDMPVGASGRVCALKGEMDVCARLREMGFCESAVIEKISGQSTLLCDLCGTRIALSSRAANHIVVELIRGGV
jgi:ferrous iron transport protein A